MFLQYKGNTLASTFTEYLYNHMFHHIRKNDFSEFDNIICNNFWKDISDMICNMTLENFEVMN